MGLFDFLTSSSQESETSDIWETISDPTQLETIIEASKDQPQLIYKHSHRCSVCFVSKGNLENAADDILESADMHFINVVNSRQASDYIASELGVRHESPQVILLDNGEVIWHASHGGIKGDAVLDKLT